jgi:hypothetical protein
LALIAFITASTTATTFTGGNLGIGIDSLSAITSGYRNTSLGFTALMNASSSFSNVAIGYKSLQAPLVGNRNVAVGDSSGAAYSGTGDDNILVGYNVGGASASSRNVIIGSIAASGGGNHVDSVLIGYQAGFNAWQGTSLYNTIVGERAGYNLGFNNGNSSFNTYLGYNAAFNANDGYGNLLLGASSTPELVSGYNNIAIGNNTHLTSRRKVIALTSAVFSSARLPATSTSFLAPDFRLDRHRHNDTVWKFAISLNNGDTSFKNNAFIIASSTGSATTTLFAVDNTGLISINGTTSIAVDTTNRNAYFGIGIYGSTTKAISSDQVFIGNGAGYDASGNLSVYIGSFSGYGSTTGALNSGTGNTAVGASTLRNNSTGFNNSAFGNNALTKSTVASNNSAFGANAMFTNTIGASNSAFGSIALNQNTIGSNNAAFGTSALQSNISGSNNVAVGVNALTSNQTGSSNIAVGFQAGFSVNASYSNILIGDNSTSNNTITSGSGNMGLGSNVFFQDPTASRQLNIGNILFGTLPATSTGFLLPTSGAIGIGTSTPFGKFAISLNNGDVSTNNFSFVIASSTQTATTTLFSIDNTGTASTTKLFGAQLGGCVAGQYLTWSAGTFGCSTDLTSAGGNPFTWTSNFGSINAATSSTLFAQNGINASSTSRFESANFNGSVGIGTTSPYSMLSISGTTTSDGGFNVNGNTNLLSYFGSTTIAVPGTNNFFAGLQANGSTTKATGSNDVFIGNAAGYAVTGIQNVYIGSFSGAGSSTGARNSANGNTAVGYQTLRNNSSGSFNAAFGVSTLIANTTGTQNAGFGPLSLTANTTGGNNAALGYASLTSNTTGGGNTAVGAGALNSNSTGTNNTALGSSAGSGLTTGTDNLFLGVNDVGDTVISTGSNNIGIGYNTYFPSASANNQLNIGNILFGTLPATTTGLVVPTSGTLGIGTSTPFAKFAISLNNGDSSFYNNAFLIASSTGSATTTLFKIDNTGTTTIANGVNILSGCFSVNGTCLSTSGSNYFTNSGASTYLSTGSKLGIGTSTPYAALSVVGEVVATNFTATSTSATSTFAGGVNIGSGALTYDYSSGVTSIQNLALGAMSFDTDSGIVTWTDLPVSSASAAGTIESYSANVDGTPLLTLFSVSDGLGGVASTSVGIGTSTPFAALSVQGANATNAAGTAQNVLAVYGGAGSTTGSGGGFIFKGGSSGDGGGTGGALTFNGGDSAFKGGDITLTGGATNSGQWAGSSIVINGQSSLITDMQFQGGQGGGSGSGFNFTGGYTLSNIGAGGSFNVAAGNAYSNGTAGAVSLTAGSGKLSGGNVTLTAGTATSSGSGGSLIFNPGVGTSAGFSGGVGVGTSSPFGLFAISANNGTVYRNNNLFLISSSTSGATSTLFNVLNNGLTAVASSTPWGLFSVNASAGVGIPQFVVGSSSVTSLIVSNAGTVGVGTSSPMARLSVEMGTLSPYSFAVANLGSSTPAFVIRNVNGNGNVGVGSSTPWALLSVGAGNSNGTNPLFSVGSTSQNFFMINNGGHVGLGTTSPSAQFAIDTTASSSGLIFAISSSSRTDMVITQSGNIGFGSSTPWGHFSFDSSVAGGTNIPVFVVGSSSRTAFAISQNGNVVIGTSTAGVATSTKFLVDSGVTTNGIIAAFGGTTSYCFIKVLVTSISCSSDVRLKQNIQTLPSALSSVMQLRPVLYNWKAEDASTTAQHIGFIAQEVLPVFPDLVTTDQNGNYAVNYGGMTPVLASALQSLDYRLEAIGTSSTSTLGLSVDLGTTTDATTSDAVLWGHSFFQNLFARVTSWLADTNNGIAKIFTKELVAENVTTKTLCLTDDSGAKTCITKAQLDNLLQGQAAGAAATSAAPTSGSGSSSSGTSTDTEAPVVSVQGNNPASVNVGDTYNDLGASATDNVDQNLSIKASIDGGAQVDLSAITIDTSIAGDHTITYSATDAAGNTGTNIRIVHVVDPNASQASASSTGTTTPDTSSASSTTP